MTLTLSRDRFQAHKITGFTALESIWSVFIMWVNGIEVGKSDMAALNKNASKLRLLAEEV